MTAEEIRVQQMSLGVMLLLYSLAELVLGFSLGSWSQVLGHTSSIGYELHLTEETLTQIRHWLVASPSFASLLHSISYRENSIAHQSVCGWDGVGMVLGLPFSFSIVQSTL